MELSLSTALASMLAQTHPHAIASEALENALAGALREAHAKWPRVTLAGESFVRFVARHLPRDRDPVAALATMHTADMGLLAACLDGDPVAFEIFDRDLLSTATPQLRRRVFPQHVLEEARQVLRHRFFVADGGSLPKAFEYSGRGTLRGWVQAAVIRASFRAIREPKGRVDGDHATLTEVASPEGDLQLHYLKRLYGPAANEALRESFAQLTVRDRNLLRQHFGLGLRLDEIARFYRVHRATAARWLRVARETLAAKTREGMMRRLHLGREEMSSVLRMLQSQLEEGVREMLAAT